MIDPNLLVFLIWAFTIYLGISKDNILKGFGGVIGILLGLILLSDTLTMLRLVGLSLILLDLYFLYDWLLREAK